MSDSHEHEALGRALGLRWEAPPSSVRHRVAKLPDVESAPALDSPETAERWVPEDVRGADLLAPATPSLRVHSFSYADVALRVLPPAGQELWRIQGRVWIHDVESAPLRLVLCQGDHVLDVREVSDGEPFELQETLGERWSLEVHVEDRPPLIVEGSGGHA